jgi:hypothetical protein
MRHAEGGARTVVVRDRSGAPSAWTRRPLNTARRSRRPLGSGSLRTSARQRRASRRSSRRSRLTCSWSRASSCRASTSGDGAPAAREPRAGRCAVSSVHGSIGHSCGGSAGPLLPDRKAPARRSWVLAVRLLARAPVFHLRRGQLLPWTARRDERRNRLAGAGREPHRRRDTPSWPASKTTRSAAVNLGVGRRMRADSRAGDLPSQVVPTLWTDAGGSRRRRTLASARPGQMISRSRR